MAENAIQQLKTCSKCGVGKSFSCFHVRRASPDGLAYKCRECVNDDSVKWRQNNAGAFKRWYQSNKHRRADYWKSWYQDNREQRSANYADWAKRNKHIINAIVAKRTAAKFKATPSWANFDAIRAVYARASWLTVETGIRHEVDHIYPLQGKTVCGLHCEANLQIISKIENIRKGNRMPEDFGFA